MLWVLDTVHQMLEELGRAHTLNTTMIGKEAKATVVTMN